MHTRAGMYTHTNTNVHACMHTTTNDVHARYNNACKQQARGRTHACTHPQSLLLHLVRTNNELQLVVGQEGLDRPQSEAGDVDPPGAGPEAMLVKALRWVGAGSWGGWARQPPKEHTPTTLQEGWNSVIGGSGAGSELHKSENFGESEKNEAQMRRPSLSDGRKGRFEPSSWVGWWVLSPNGTSQW